MTGPSWLVDSKRIATKIKSASSGCDPKRVIWKSNPSRACPKCNHHIDNSDVIQEWPGLPCGVKFDPSDQEIIWHLLAKVGNGNLKPHPYIEEFIPTVNEEDGICYTHPQNLPGVKQDGSVSHFFHRAIKAYNTGTRKRRKIHGDNLGDVRWHKTGRTKPVILHGIQMGCKKIMVLYMSTTKTGKPEKTNWVMHQYHLGTGEDENDGEFVVSKIFYQQQAKLGEKVENDLPREITEGIITKVDPVTPKFVICDRPRTESWQSDVDPGQECEPCVTEISAQKSAKKSFEELPIDGILGGDNNYLPEPQENHVVGDQEDVSEDLKLRECESEYPFYSQGFELLDTQQLIEGLSMADGLLWSQSSNGEGADEERKNLPCLSDYARLGVDTFKNDLKECQKSGVSDLPNSTGRRMLKSRIDYGETADYPKQDLEFQNTGQLEFDSQDSFFAWAASKLSD